MIRLGGEQSIAVKHWFLPDRPGPLVGLHVLNTGHGAIYADRWPDPTALLAETADNYSLHGHPQALDPKELRRHIAGFVEAPDSFLPLLRAACPELKLWQRIVLQLRGDAPGRPNQAATVRRVAASDRLRLEQLHGEIDWILKTWGDASGMASSGHAWVAVAGARIVSLACTFFVGERYEEIGVATEPAWRGRGLATSCAAALCGEIMARGRIPSWTTSPDNAASLRLARSLGFRRHRRDRLFVIGRPVPGNGPSARTG